MERIISKEELIKKVVNLEVSSIIGNMLKIINRYDKPGILYTCIDSRTGELGIEYKEIGKELPEDIKYCVVIARMETPYSLSKTGRIDIRSIISTKETIGHQLNTLYKEDG